jgi:TonB family protein
MRRHEGKFALAAVVALGAMLGGVSAASVYVPARAIEREPPSFPLGARIEAREGWVRTSFCVDSTGAVRDPVVIASSGGAPFEREAVRAVRKWTYAPATLDGRAVEQCFTGALVVFQLTPVEPGARTTFVSQWKRIRKDIAAGRAEAAAKSLSRLEPWNNYEYTHATMLRAELARAQGDAALEARLLQSVVWFRQYLDPEAEVSVHRRLFFLMLDQGQFASALSTYESLATVHADSLTEWEQRAGEGLRAAVRSDKVLATPLRLRDRADGESGVATSSTRLIRRAFGFADATGQFDRFELRCNAKWYTAEVRTDQTWTVPESWGDCTLFVFGEYDGSVRLLERPDRGAQPPASPPSSEAPAASAAATAD